ncbi:MASE3 domain-containing protein [Azospirillum thermophilum]|nr:MASE3 domain-containing protein [Azospirillum thermophilum]
MSASLAGPVREVSVADPRLPVPLALALAFSVAAGAFWVSRQNYLLFHSVVETFRVLTAASIFAIAWHSRRYLGGGNLWFLGVSFGCTGVITLFHMLAYKGMGVFPGADANLATQLWIASRGMGALAVCIAAFTPHRHFPPVPTLAGVAGVTGLLLASIFLYPVFPDCYVEGQGLTPFKRVSEYVIVAAFLTGLVGLHLHRDRHRPTSRTLVAMAFGLDALGDFAFTLYVDVYGTLNFLGHAFVTGSDMLVYTAIVRSGIRRPQNLVFWMMESDRRALRAVVERQNVKLLETASELQQEHAELEQTRQILDGYRARESAILDTVGEAILTLDAAGTVTFGNGAAQRLSPDLRVGEPAPAWLQSAIGAAGRGGQPEIELSLTASGGAGRTIELAVRPLPSDTGALVAVLRDVTGKRELERQALRHAAALRRSLVETIGVVSQMVAMRDPYTAGHQRRVACLAYEIAREMGLEEEEAVGIALAGTVHDIGKISVPAEVLNRPGRLTAIEYELLKTHAQAGYEIIKNAQLPWPVADMIHQHHEKLDGSGYPQGLKGEQIVRGARILAVADVVEAMASHRPYRPALGIEAALAEIERCAGVSLDAAAVAACTRLFRERGYAFSELDAVTFVLERVNAVP